MIKSMTAFASAESRIEQMTIYCELRSVNHRYSDVTLKLPELFKFAESDIRALLGQSLSRGKIECVLNYKKVTAVTSTVHINSNVVQAIVSATEEIEGMMKKPQLISALDILMCPGVQVEQEVPVDDLAPVLSALVTEALTDLVALRIREGAELALLLKQRSQQMQQFVDRAFIRLPEVLEQIRQRMNRRIEELSIDPDLDRLEQEMVLITHKLDVAEELDRLTTHLKEVEHNLNQNQPVGRRLDFLMQEMNREANTLGSKSGDKEMTQIAIELKVLIEQMREQVQNIE